MSLGVTRGLGIRGSLWGRKVLTIASLITSIASAVSDVRGRFGFVGAHFFVCLFLFVLFNYTLGVARVLFANNFSPRVDTRAGAPGVGL